MNRPFLSLVLIAVVFAACGSETIVTVNDEHEAYNSYLTSHDLLRSGALSPEHKSERRRIRIETYEAFQFMEDGTFYRQIRVANGQRDSLSISTLGLTNPLILVEEGKWKADYPYIFFLDVTSSVLRVDNTFRTENIEVVQRRIHLFIEGEHEDHYALLGYDDNSLSQYEIIEKGVYGSLVE